MTSYLYTMGSVVSRVNDGECNKYLQVFGALACDSKAT